MISTSIIPVQGHDMYFYPDHVVNFFEYYIKNGICERVGRSYRELKDANLFGSTLRLLF